MSTWGGIGEGLAAGINNHIAHALQEREHRRQQANADRAFDFQQSEAKRAQSNADRAFAANREDARNQQANTDRAFAEGARRADRAFDFQQSEAQRAQSNADRAFAANREDARNQQANTDRAFAEGARRADRAFAANREDAKFNQQMADRKIDLESARLNMAKEAQDWQNKLAAEKLDTFKMQNNQLRDAWQKEQERNEIIRKTGQTQLAHGVYAMQTMKDMLPESVMEIEGKQTKVRVMPQNLRNMIFGSDGPISDISSMFYVDTAEGPRIGFVRNGDGGQSVHLLGDDEQFNILKAGASDQFANSAMSDYVAKRDVGFRLKEAEGKAMATARATMATDPYGRKRSTDAAIAILKSADANDKQRARALATLEANLGNMDGASERMSALEELARKRGLVRDANGVWRKK